MRSSFKLYIALASLVAFILWSALLLIVDVHPIGPNGSSVGFAALNGGFHRLTGVHMGLYTVTDWLGLVPIAFVLGFAVLGFVQLVKRKSLAAVDRNIIFLGIFYVAVGVVFLLFEKLEVNYRPVLINGVLEASYPSSTTLLSLCVIPTAVMQLGGRIKKTWLRRTVSVLLWGFTVFMVIGRVISGVHWLTDIIGGLLVSVALVSTYSFFAEDKISE